MSPPLLERLALTGLETASSQVWRGIRLVPLLRKNVQSDLRIDSAVIGDLSLAIVEGTPDDPSVLYGSYVPHGLVVSWSDDGTPAASFGTHFLPREAKRSPLAKLGVPVFHRMAKKTGDHTLRLLPLHLAMEGFLALHFNGPDVAWSEYSRRALSTGLSPRVEASYRGSWIEGLEDALRTFEIHDRQVGVLLFAADALASAFVVSHPDDYRALHRTLLEDFYGELIAGYASLHPTTAPTAPAAPDAIASIADLRRELDRFRTDWAAHHDLMTSGLIGRAVTASRVNRMGPFHLGRFVTALVPGEENHIGELIVRTDGTIEYLKTFRLSAAQTKRAYLLERLAAHHWNLDATAAALRTDREGLSLRLTRAGFDYLLKDHVLAAARRKK